ncbi:MAG: MerR family transcriptional regulator [bacterium]
MKKVHWFGSSVVTKQLGISLRQLYYWELKGIVQPRVISKGSREFKRFSLEDIETLKMVKTYLDEGYTLTSAVERANHAVVATKEV